MKKAITYEELMKDSAVYNYVNDQLSLQKNEVQEIFSLKKWFLNDFIGITISIYMSLFVVYGFVFLISIIKNYISY